LLYDDATGQLLTRIEMAIIARGDGGFADGRQRASAAAKPSPAVATDRVPDQIVELATLLQAALIYRLSGDLNPLHADPAVARKAGFQRPILHGLATYGVAARAILTSTCDDDPSRLRRLNARFSAPVYPGETIRTEIWRDGGNVAYRCHAAERSVLVITNGFAEIGAVAERET
jgi:acyl dehydratase